MTTSGVLSGKTIKSISAGDWHTCAVASDNQAYCWGYNADGQLGNNSTTDRTVPVAVNTSGVLAGKTIQSIEAGNWHTCVIASNGLAYCWGLNSGGQLGNNSTTDRTVPVAVTTSGVLAGKMVKSIAAGDSHTCVIASDNQAYCWGEGTNGRLGNNSATTSSVPVSITTTGVLADKTAQSITAGYSHTCVIASDNQVYCWGEDTNGRLGNDASVDSPVAIAVNNQGVLRDTMPDIKKSNLKLQLQYAPKPVSGICAAASGWAAVTNSSLISYDNVAPNNGLTISALGGNNPDLPIDSTSFAYQTTIRNVSASAYTFTNSVADIRVGETGLWDFVLKDRSATASTDYCFRLITDVLEVPGSSVDAYSAYPEIKTALGDLSIRFANSSNATLTDPTTTFTSTTTNSVAQTTTGALSNASTQQLEVANSSSSTGWSVSLAATNGPTTKWMRSDSGSSYPFNNATAANGQLSINTSSGAFTATGTTPSGSACSTTGLAFGSNSSFVSGSVDAVTIATASSASGFNCTFKLQNINLSQIVPKYQPSGTYTINMTATVVAQ